jgi:hypothetical protein
MTSAFHAMPLKHYVRRLMLHLIAGIPVLPARPRTANRILLIRPDHLGDVLLTTPAIHALRTAYPKAELHALVGPWSANVLASYPEIDLVLTLPFPGFSRHPTPGSLVGSDAGLSGRHTGAHRLQSAGYGALPDRSD